MNTEKMLGILLAVLCIAMIAGAWYISPSFARTACIIGAIGAGMGSVWMLTLKYASR